MLWRELVAMSRICCCAALLVTLSAAAQDPNPPAPPSPAPAPAQASPGPATLKLSTQIVVLDVVVLDRQNRIVPKVLTRDDFQVFEDKTPQTIRSFEPPSAHAEPPGVEVHSAADLKRIGDAPVTLLVLDELNTRFEDSSFARQAMIKYLRAQPAVLGQPTVLLLVSNTRFQQLHDYTQNRDELIERIQHQPPEIPFKQQQGRGGAAAVERMAQTLSSLEQIAQASAGTPGRKNVIWVGSGFPSADLVGLDDRTAATIEGALRQCTGQLQAARVTMYTIDPTLNSTVVVDVETPEDLTVAETETGSSPYEGSIQFATLGPATGGRAFLSRNDLGNEIAEGIAQGTNYYTLSYVPLERSTDAARYRRIRVVMHDPALHATTRNGYYPPTAATENVAATEPPKQARAQLQLELSNAVNSAISYNGLTLAATHDGTTYTVRAGGSALSWRPVNDTTEQAEVTVLAAWFDAKGRLLGHTARELTAQRALTADQAAPATFSLPVTLTGSPARLRLVVRDAGNARIGTVDLKP